MIFKYTRELVEKFVLGKKLCPSFTAQYYQAQIRNMDLK